MAEVVTVATNETIEQIRSRLARVAAREVYLYIPNHNHVLRQRMSLALVRRAADDMGLVLTVVSRDSAIRVAAANAGLPVAWHLPREQVDGRRFDRRITGIGASPLLLLGLATILLAAGMVIGILVRPRATIVVTPSNIEMSQTILIEADPSVYDVDATDGRMPARRLAVELHRGRREPTTARTDVPDQAARGTVVLLNQGESEVVIPAGSRVATAGNPSVTFRTLGSVVLPGPAGTTARVPVQAVEPGPVGNVPAYAVNVLDPTLAVAVAVVNDQPMTGGSTRRIGAVTPEERDRVQDQLLQRVRAEARHALSEELRQGETLVDDSVAVNVLDESFAEPAAAEQGMVQVDLAVRIEGIAVDLDQAQRLAEEILAGELAARQEVTDMQLDSQIQAISLAEPGTVTIEVQTNAKGTSRIVPAEVRRAVRGRRIEDAESVLGERFPLASAPLIDVSHTWLGRLPWLPYQIDVVIVNSATRVG
jgi:hypothetical protein